MMGLDHAEIVPEQLLLFRELLLAGDALGFRRTTVKRLAGALEARKAELGNTTTKSNSESIGWQDARRPAFLTLTVLLELDQEFRGWRPARELLRSRNLRPSAGLVHGA